LMRISGVRACFVDASRARQSRVRTVAEHRRKTLERRGKIAAGHPRKITAEHRRKMLDRQREMPVRQGEMPVEVRRRVLVYRLRLRLKTCPRVRLRGLSRVRMIDLDAWCARSCRKVERNVDEGSNGSRVRHVRVSRHELTPLPNHGLNHALSQLALSHGLNRAWSHHALSHGPNRVPSHHALSHEPNRVRSHHALSHGLNPGLSQLVLSHGPNRVRSHRAPIRLAT
jgi:hypothetical protein